jgi:acetyl-CoA carboxylase carboxyl transferase subunit beta
MAWFRRKKKGIETPAEVDRSVKTEGLWEKCAGCQKIVWKKDLEANQNICSHCQHHYRINSLERLTLLFDNGKFIEHDEGLESTDPLEFTDTKPYAGRLKAAQEKMGMKDAIRVGEGLLAGRTVQIAAMDFGFIGGSMGAVVGEKVTRAAERSLERKMPLVVVSSSGGARMMEGAVSLMQMAKISAALARLDDAPTTGGVTACYAMLGDLNIAEPGALIGFAGPRVIEQTIRQKLPKGFQRSEFLQEKGFLDAIVHRKEMKNYVARALEFMSPQ